MEQKLKILNDNIKVYPNFPKEGVLFRDIFGIFGNPEATRVLYEVLLEECQQYLGKVTSVCGLDSRGFLFGPQIALQLKVPFVPIRKKGKLPGVVLCKSFDLEYGTDAFEVQSEHLPQGNVLIVDDLLATGGSLKAAGQLVEALNCKVEKCLVIMELEGLKGRSNIPYGVHSILRY